jgi:hypothetical protein
MGRVLADVVAVGQYDKGNLFPSFLPLNIGKKLKIKN